MKKNFFKFSLTLNIVLAALSVAFSLIYYFSSTSIADGEGFLSFLYYVKTFFDLLAVFVGYTTIIYAFTRSDFKGGLLAVGIFAISFLISFVFLVVGSCIDNSSVFTVDFFVYVIYYSFGSSFITQMIPALFAALITYLLTKNGAPKITKLFSWKNPVQKSMIIITLSLFGASLLLYTGFNMIPGVVLEFSKYGGIYASSFKAIIISYVEITAFYLIMQYLVYHFMFKIYDAYTICSNPKGKVKK